MPLDRAAGRVSRPSEATLVHGMAADGIRVIPTHTFNHRRRKKSLAQGNAHVSASWTIPMPWDETEWAQSGEWGLDAVSAAEVEAPAEDSSRGAPAEDVRGGRRRQQQ